MPHYDFIEIGTSDAATLIQRAGPTTRGISVEPINEYLARLPSPPLVVKVNAAISDVTGTTEIYYVPDDLRQQHGLPTWMKGTNSIGHPHPTVVRHLTRHGLPLSLIHTRSVPLISLTELLASNDVTSIGQLKIDTEGHDTVIMRQMLDVMTNGGPMPSIIKFEANSLSKRDEVAAIVQELVALGYTIRQTTRDVIATRQ